MEQFSNGQSQGLENEPAETQGEHAEACFNQIQMLFIVEMYDREINYK